MNDTPKGKLVFCKIGSFNPDQQKRMHVVAERTFLAPFEITQSARDLLRVLQSARGDRGDASMR